MRTNGWIGKALVTLFTAVAAGIVAALTDNQLSAAELINTAIIGISAIGVYFVPNLTGGSAKFAKAIVAGLAAVGTLAVNLIVDGVTISEWLQMVIAFCGAAGVIIPRAPQYGALKAA